MKLCLPSLLYLPISNIASIPLTGDVNTLSLVGIILALSSTLLLILLLIAFKKN